MANPKVADRVLQISTSTGTGAFNLSTSVTGYFAWSAKFTTGDTVFYTIEHQSADEHETGIGTVTTGSPWTLTRSTILSSSNAGAAVNFTAGDKNVFCSMPAADRREGTVHAPHLSGLYYGLPVSPSSASAAALSADFIYGMPMSVPKRGDYDRISIHVTSFAASSNVRLGIYATGDDGLPGALILDAGTIATDTTGAKDITISQTLNAGCYWLVMNTSHAISVTGLTTTGLQGWLGRVSIVGSGSGRNIISEARAYAALSDPCGAITSIVLIGPHIALRKA